jgi:NADH-quinone oxidoreductase subunit G
MGVPDQKRALGSHSGHASPALMRLIGQSMPLSAVRNASFVLAIGVDARYEQSVLGVELKKAKRKGATVVSVHPKPHHLSRVADQWLRVEFGRLNTQDELLTEQLKSATQPLILLGADALHGAHASVVLDTVQRMVESSGAGVIVLSLSATYLGSLIIGSSAGVASGQGKVLYLVGKSDVAERRAEEFVIAQNLYPPASPEKIDLMLPAAAFTESDGTIITPDRTLRHIRKAVNPPGEAQAHWQILGRLARALGKSGFDWADAEEIRAEMMREIPALADPRTHVWNALVVPDMSLTSLFPTPNGNRYHGIRLADKVKGLADLATNGKL